MKRCILLAALLLLAACGGPSRPALSTATPSSPPAIQTSPATTLLAPTAAPTPAPLPSLLPTAATTVAPVVYADPAGLWAYDGSVRRRLLVDYHVYAPLLSPDGRRVLFRRHEAATELSADPFSMALLDLQTGQETAVDLAALPTQPLELDGRTLALPHWPLKVVWMPDSQSLLFNTAVDYSMIGPGSGPRDDLWQLDAATGRVRSLSPGTDTGSFTLSPDGRWVLVSRPDQVETLELATGRRTILLEFPSVLTYSEYAWLPEPCWTPDSRDAHVAIAPADPMQSQAYELYALDVVRGTVQKVGSVEGSPFAWSPDGRSWSPDGTRLAYVASKGNARSVMLAGADGSGTVTASQGSAPHLLGWSPDSSAFFYQDGNTLYGLEVGPPPRASRLAEVGDTPAVLLWLGTTLVVDTGDGHLLRVALDGSGVQVP